MERSEVNYGAIFENTGAASIVISQDSLILLVNKKFEKLSRYRRHEIEGKKKWPEFVIEDDLATVDKCTWRQEPADDEIKDECEFRFVDQGGGIKYILAAITEIPFTKTAIMSLLDITERKLAEEALTQRERELEMKSRSLEEANIAMKFVLKQKEEDKATLEKQMLINLRALILPFIENLRHLTLNNAQLAQVKMIEKQLHDITSPFLRNISIAFRDLTPREIQVASLIKDGMTTKEIAGILHIAETSVSYHRKNLRSRLGIAYNGKISLYSYLHSLYA